MSNEQRYYKEAGEVSKTGKTYVRVSKSGRKYYHNPTRYKEIKEEKIQKILAEGGNPPARAYEHKNQRSKSICYDPDSESYMRYFEKKVELRKEYPSWVHMKRDEYREYFKRLWDLILFDEDFQHWLKVDSKTIEEKRTDEWWEEKKRKDADYDGRGDEYGY
jgi:hypothetical protein